MSEPTQRRAVPGGNYLALVDVAYDHAVEDGALSEGTPMAIYHCVAEPLIDVDHEGRRAALVQSIRESRRPGDRRPLVVITVAHERGCFILWPTPAPCDCWADVQIGPLRAVVS